jgi:hypothetical protein
VQEGPSIEVSKVGSIIARLHHWRREELNCEKGESQSCVKKIIREKEKAREV